MRLLARLFQPAAAPVRSMPVRLSFLTLESRDCPSTTAAPYSGGTGTQPAASTSPTAATQSPQCALSIINFDVSESVQGWCTFTGTVVGATAGQVVTFSGVPSVNGKQVVTDANGNFSLTVQLKTDGSDAGSVSVVTTDANGVQSNQPFVTVSPTGGVS